MTYRIASSIPWRFRLLFHDGLIHPLAAILWVLRLDRLAKFLHESTLPMVCRTCRIGIDGAVCACGEMTS